MKIIDDDGEALLDAPDDDHSVIVFGGDEVFAIVPSSGNDNDVVPHHVVRCSAVMARIAQPGWLESVIDEIFHKHQPPTPERKN